MRIAFAGSHEISWYCLRAIAELCRDRGDELVGAFNHPVERGERHSAFVTFDGLESEFGFPHYRVDSLSAPEVLEQLRALRLDVLFVIGWHRIVPQAVIDTARFCLGIHASLLPRNRGSSPINWSLVNGDSVGGLSYFHLSAGVDTGDLVGQRSWAIGPRDTCRDLYDRATIAAVELLREHWDALREGRIARQPQEESLATTNGRRRPEDGAIDWRAPAPIVDRLVRATTHPYPGAFTTFRGRRLYVWDALPIEPDADFEPGQVAVRDGVVVGTGAGALALGRVQVEGEPECAAAVFATVHRVRDGETLGVP